MTHSQWIDRVLELREALSGLPAEERAEALSGLPARVKKKALRSPYLLGRDKQVEALTSDADTVLMLAGRGFGKGWTGAHWLLDRIERGHRATAIVAETAADVRDDVVEPAEKGSGVVEFAKNRELEPNFKRSESRIEYKAPHGAARSQTYSGDAGGEDLRGFSGSVAWIDELAKMRYARSVWEQINLTLREASGDLSSQLLVTTTPRPTPLIRELVEDPQVHVISGSSWENRANLDDRFARRLEKLEGTRLGRQEVAAEVLTGSGDLWDYDDITRAANRHDLPDFQRVCIGLDPSISNSTQEGTDEAGIVVVGLGTDGVAYVLADLSGDYTVDEWGAVTTAAYAGDPSLAREYLQGPVRDEVGRAISQEYPWRRADVIHAEINQGGSLVTQNIQSFGSHAAVNATHTTQSKRVRAEPVHHLYQREAPGGGAMVQHVGALSDLEDQLTSFQQDGDSPDRADALCYAVQELLLGDVSALSSDHVIPTD